MGSLIRLVAAISIVLSLHACAGTVKVVNAEALDAIKGSTITVVSHGNDPENVRGLIEQALIEKGYKVVSEEVARKETQVEATSIIDGNAQVTVGSVYNQTTVKSVYVLSFTYSTRPDFPHGVVIHTLSGSIIDLRSGVVKSSMRFSQGDFGSTSTEAAIDKLLEQM